MPEKSIVSPEEWQAARADLLEEEKRMTRALDRLAASRRRMPWQRVERTYSFTGPDGKSSLDDLFEGRSQLIVYHHMLKDQDPSPCPGCCMVMDQICHPAHLNARDTTFAVVSKAPIAEIEAFRARMGWPFPWYETRDGFNADFDVASNHFGLNVFVRKDGGIFRTYFTTNRGAEWLGNVWSLLDITPYGRQEDWQEAPEGTPQTPPYQWWRLHDEY